MNLFNNQSRFLDRFFRKVDGLVWDLSTGRLGVQGKDGIATLDVTEAAPAAEGRPAQAAAYSVSINPFDGFGISVPAFATNTPQEQIAVGDLIVGAKGILGWVIEKKAASLVLLSQDGMQKQYNPPKVAVFGQDGSMVVKSLNGLLGGDGAQSFSSSLLPLLVMGEGTGLDLEKLIPLMLFQQQGAAGAGGNPLAQMMPMMLMLGALKGNGVAQASYGSVNNPGVPPLSVRTRG